MPQFDHSGKALVAGCSVATTCWSGIRILWWSWIVTGLCKSGESSLHCSTGPCDFSWPVRLFLTNRDCPAANDSEFRPNCRVGSYQLTGLGWNLKTNLEDLDLFQLTDFGKCHQARFSVDFSHLLAEDSGRWHFVHQFLFLRSQSGTSLLSPRHPHLCLCRVGSCFLTSGLHRCGCFYRTQHSFIRFLVISIPDITGVTHCGIGPRHSLPGLVTLVNADQQQDFLVEQNFAGLQDFGVDAHSDCSYTALASPGTKSTRFYQLILFPGDFTDHRVLVFCIAIGVGSLTFDSLAWIVYFNLGWAPYFNYWPGYTYSELISIDNLAQRTDISFVIPWVLHLLAQRLALVWNILHQFHSIWTRTLESFLYFSFFWQVTLWFFGTLQQTPLCSGASNSKGIADCKPGPKSRRWIQVFLLLFCGFWSCQTAYSCTGSNRSEGCTSAMGSAEMSTDWTQLFIEQHDMKQHGTRPPMCARTPVVLNPKASPVVKRSLHRAQRRAAKSGMTWYRGRCLVPADFLKMGMQPIETALPQGNPAHLAACNMHNTPRKRLTCMTWNGGGLSNHRLDELKQWLFQQHIQIAVVTETRWSFDSTWSDGSWHHVHSTDPNHRGSGVLILVAKALCDANCLRWNAIIPGRLLHVRLHLTPRNIDILGSYQHVFSRDKECLQRRAKFWASLEQQIQMIPNRNTVILLGNFNCSLSSTPGVSGTSTFRWNNAQVRGQQHADCERFAQILRSCGLVALNAWDSSLGPTFIHQGYASRIDFICTRQQLADGRARQIQYLWEAPFLPPGHFGHAPMVCHLARYWVPPPHHAAFGLTPHQKRSGRLAKLADDWQWHQFLETSGVPITNQLHRALTLAAPELTQVHDVAMQCFSNSFPRMSAAPNRDPWQMNPSVLSKWEHRSKARQFRACHIASCFSAWYHIAKYQTLSRLHRRFAQKLRRQRFEEIVQQANHAALTHNTHQMFDLINRFAPKTPKRRMQLRNDQGALMTIPEERSLLIAFVRQTWYGQPMTLRRRPCPSPPGVPFSVQELAQALRGIPTIKAVAPPCAPGCIWNSHADDIAPVLHEILTQWWSSNDPWIPAMWRSGWLQLIPKPNKPPTKPQNLRPLAIQCPLGKAVLGLLVKKAAQQADPMFRKLPLWAFLAHRSTQDPLLKVAAHCRAVQHLTESQKSTPHSRAALLPRLSCFGGLQIFVDIDKAFDSVNRSKLFCRLHQLRIDEDVAQLLQRWHFDTSYFVTHGGESQEVGVNRGLRQGCKGAPFLWNCLITLLLSDLQTVVPLAWIQEHLSVYADDCHVGGEFRNVADFTLLLQTISLLFSMFHEFDLAISPQKSVAILSMHGHLARKTRAAHTTRDHTGENLKLRLDHTEMLIPIQRHASYLGCILGYHNFADATTWHRVRLARIGFSRLRRWLCNRTHFSVQQRIRLWRCCVIPIMTYGVFAVGTTPKGIRHMLTQLSLMLRTIVRDHPHHTGNTNEQVFTAFALPRPAAILLAAVDSFQRSMTQRQSHLQADDLAQTLTWDHLATIRTQIHEAQAELARHRVETALSGEVHCTAFQYKCRLCNFGTDSVAAFRRHCNVSHGFVMFRHFDHSLHEFCTEGLPTCKFCQQSFSTWRSFRIHIERGCQALFLGPAPCTGIPLKTAMTQNLQLPHDAASTRGLVLLSDTDLGKLLAMPWGSRVLQLLSTDRLCQLEQEREACAYLSKYCFLCGQHAHRIQDLHWHFSTEHAQYWTHVPAKAKMMCNRFCTESPCQFCGSGFRTHQCPVWTQLAILALHGGGFPLPVSEQAETAHRCDVCLALFSDSAQLTQHLASAHKITGVTFNVARGSLDG